MDDDDSYLYGESTAEEPVKAEVQTSVPQPISLEQTRSATEGLVAKLEEQAADANNEDGVEEDPEENEAGEEEDEDEDDDSEDDVEIIMEEPQSRRSLDFRQIRPASTRSTSATFSTPQRPPQPPPSLTTEYTPRERATLTKSSSTPQPASQAQTPLPSIAAQPGTTEKPAEAEKEAAKDTGPDPSTLPPATAPPSHPSINPSAVGKLDGRSILEVDLNSLAEKPWRRPGSDISDWFNYGFDEVSWEAYCYRRQELGEHAGMLKNNVLNFSGMSEDQLIALPPDVRAMVMAGATTVMAGGGGGGPGGGGMMPPGAGMNMNGGPMMNQMMMMNPMMDMGVGMGDMSMMQDGGGGGGGGPQGGAQGASEGQVGMGMGVGEGFGPGGGPGGQGMMGIGMNPDFAMQDPNAMGPQMYPGMEGSGTPTPVPSGPSRGVAPGFRARGMPQGMRGRGAGFAGRGRGVPMRPASPLPPNVPTGPRNKNKYKDIDGSAPAVDGLDYGGGAGGGGGGNGAGAGGGERDRSERSERSERDRKERGTPDLDERDRSSRKRRASPGEREESRSSKRR